MPRRWATPPARRERGRSYWAIFVAKASIAVGEYVPIRLLGSFHRTLSGLFRVAGQGYGGTGKCRFSMSHSAEVSNDAFIAINGDRCAVREVVQQLAFAEVRRRSPSAA